MIEGQELETKLIEKLESAGWSRQGGFGVYSTYSTKQIVSINLDRVDCVLYTNGRVIALIEAIASPDLSASSQRLFKLQEYAKNYTYDASTPRPIQLPIPFIFVYNGEKIIFQDLKDINSNPREIKNFYTPSDLTKMLTTIPYGPTNVTAHFSIFLKYLKLALILVYNNSISNRQMELHFSDRHSGDKYYAINKKTYGIKRILQFAYFLFNETFLMGNDWFNLDNKQLEDIKPKDYPAKSYTIEFKTQTELISIVQGKRISVKDSGVVSICYAEGFVRDVASYSIPVYEKFKENGDRLIKFGENNENNLSQQNYRCINKFTADNPTNKDDLERESDAERLGLFLMNEKTETPLNFAIISNWGAGKSSFMKFITSTFEKIKTGKLNNIPEYANYKNAKIIHFNAWQYDNETQIGLALLNEMYSQLNTAKKFEAAVDNLKSPQFWGTLLTGIILLIILVLFIFSAQNISLGTELFDTLVKCIGLILGSGGVIAFLVNISKFLGKIYGNIAGYKYTDLYRDNIDIKHRIKTEINRLHKYLSGKDERLVMFIDDLDRCSKDAIINLLDVLSIYFSGMKDVITIINIDIALIIDAVNHKLKYQNSTYAIKYLEKIIQLNYNIPEIEAEQYKNLFNKLLPENIIHEEQVFSEQTTESKENITIEPLINEPEEDFDTEEGNTPAEILLALPDKTKQALLSFFEKVGEILQFDVRKSKRIINILRILTGDLSSNDEEYDAKVLVPVVCLLEKYPALTKIIYDEFSYSDISSINLYKILNGDELLAVHNKKEIAFLIQKYDFNITLEKNFYKIISKYIFDIGRFCKPDSKL